MEGRGQHWRRSRGAVKVEQFADEVRKLRWRWFGREQRRCSECPGRRRVTRREETRKTSEDICSRPQRTFVAGAEEDMDMEMVGVKEKEKGGRG